MFYQPRSKRFLTVSQVDMIRRTFLIIGADSVYAEEIFYRHLFRIKPELEDLLDRDSSIRSKKLTNMLGLIVSQIHNLPELLPMLGDLASRHIDYGVRAEHYHDVGRALIAMLRDILGSEFDSDAEAAWVKAYDGIAVSMIGITFGDAGAVQYQSASNICQPVGKT
ncbi:globin domain-containing protein [Sphingorhabdus sp. Alg231-15]|uniref:globin domain-containing protein n=1 Tax=Sphingorhabdus sp. Alg231-15 TaxID=1922222 RepID=UPI000D56124F